MPIATMILALGAAQGSPFVEHDKIVVVGQRPGDTNADGGIGVTVLTDSEIAALSIDRLSDVAETTPNLSAIPAGVMAVEQYTVRGLHSPVGSPTVGLYLDDVPLSVRPGAFLSAPDLQALDLAGVDVLRGAQGTQSGASALAGIVRMKARQPDFDVSQADASSELRITEQGAPTLRTAAAFGLPIHTSMAIRAAGSVERLGGYVNRVGIDPRADVNHVVTGAGRAILAMRAGGWVVSPSVTVQRRRSGDLPLMQEGLGPLQQAFVRRQPGRDDLAAASVRLDGSVGTVAVTANAALLDRTVRQNVDYSPVFGELVLGGATPGLLVPGGSESMIRSRQRTATGELRVSSGSKDARWAWVAGVQAGRSVLRIAQTVEEPGIAELTRDFLQASVEEVFGTPLLDGLRSYRSAQRDRETSVAGYGTAYWRPTDRLQLTAGARAAVYRVDLLSGDAGPYAGSGALLSQRSRRASSRVLPRVSAAWRASPRHEAAASWSRGYRPGGGNVPVPENLCADDLAELGRTGAPLGYSGDDTDALDLSYRFAAAHASMSLGAFTTRWRNVAQQVDLPGCGFGYVDNTGRAHLRGLEAEAIIAPVHGLTLRAGAGYVDARFTQTVGAPGASVLVSRGDRLPFVPPWTAHLTTAWERQLPGEALLSLGLAYRYASSFRRTPAAPANGFIARVYSGPAVSRIDARAKLQYAALSLEAFVRNLADVRPLRYASIDLTPVTRFPARTATITPRTWGLRLAWRMQP